eukprot:TRINITY_DN9558_c0_g1_i1.p2 TRINITY_DN9558_c0_g1~~TRINITY_DN9558_c0_g1_i1.p2  ORF type:complete len:359 (+),score=120.18 TRINITY_DN9558_c0_g1_i1:341-1417(+)
MFRAFVDRAAGTVSAADWRGMWIDLTFPAHVVEVPVPVPVPVSLSLREDDGGVFAARSGSITDGFERYPNSADLRVTVQGTNCVLSWREMGVEDSGSATSCRFDAVAVLVGGMEVVRQCGHDAAALPDTQLTGDEFTVVFTSDSTLRFSGFVMDFACDMDGAGATPATGVPATPSPATMAPPTAAPPTPPTGVEVSVEVRGGGNGPLTLCEVQVLVGGANVALGARTEMSPVSARWGGAKERAVDGSTSGNFGEDSCTHTEGTGADEFWKAHLNVGSADAVSEIKVFNRADCCAERLVGAALRLVEDGVVVKQWRLDGGRVFSTACFDTEPRCERFASFCADHPDLMHGACPKTCGRC